jgi:hypothetical protein
MINLKVALRSTQRSVFNQQIKKILAKVVITLGFKKFIMTPDGITFLMKKVVFSQTLLETLKKLT